MLPVAAADTCHRFTKAGIPFTIALSDVPEESLTLSRIEPFAIPTGVAMVRQPSATAAGNEFGALAAARRSFICFPRNG